MIKSDHYKDDYNYEDEHVGDDEDDDDGDDFYDKMLMKMIIFGQGVTARKTG